MFPFAEFLSTVKELQYTVRTWFECLSRVL